jgi:hypothetical protein
MTLSPTISTLTPAVEIRAPLPASLDNRVKQIPEATNTAADIKKISEPVEESKQEEDPNRTEPKNDGEKLSVKLYEVIKGLTDKMGNFSLFEMSMAGIGSVLTKGSPYWLSYFCASFVEWVENKATSNKDYAMPKWVTKLFNTLCKWWRVKDKHNQELTWDKALTQGIREKVIGTFNASLSLFTLTYSLSKPLLALAGIGQKQKKQSSSPLMRTINTIAKGVLPVVNAGLIWSSAAGKALLGHALADLPKPPMMKVNRADGKHKLEPLDISGHLQSSKEDDICGRESTGLMIGHLIDMFNPALGRIYDTCLGIIISLQSFLNGRKGMRGEEEGGNLSLRERYPLGILQKGAIGQFFYSSVRNICKLMGLELPHGEDIASLIKNNNPLEQLRLLNKFNQA